MLKKKLIRWVVPGECFPDTQKEVILSSVNKDVGWHGDWIFLVFLYMGITLFGRVPFFFGLLQTNQWVCCEPLIRLELDGGVGCVYKGLKSVAREQEGTTHLGQCRLEDNQCRLAFWVQLGGKVLGTPDHITTNVSSGCIVRSSKGQVPINAGSEKSRG